MNSFNVVIDPGAEKDLKKFKRSNPKLLSRLINAIDSLTHNPYQGKPQTIHIIRAGHRREIYR